MATLNRNAPWLSVLCVLVACSQADPPLAPASADRAAFEAEVLPVLIADCGFHACHGNLERFFQVFGPGHGRLAAESRPIDELTRAEVQQSYVRALSMIDTNRLEDSLLLRKPLAISAGGTGHEGSDSFGRNVYVSREDPHYVLLRRWVLLSR